MVLEAIATINQAVNNFVWGIPAMVCIIGVGLLLSVRTGFLQIRKFPYAIKTTIGRMFRKKDASDGAMTPFQAVCTALAGTVGTGNIAGVAGAIAIGGPGAVFWMWCSALLGMCTKFAEVTLAVHFRERSATGEWVGGPMYYIKNGLGKHWQFLAVLYSLFGVLTVFGTGNATQVNTIVAAIDTALTEFNVVGQNALSTLNLVVGIVVAMLVAMVLLGGIKRIGSVSERLPADLDPQHKGPRQRGAHEPCQHPGGQQRHGVPGQLPRMSERCFKAVRRPHCGPQHHSQQCKQRPRRAQRRRPHTAPDAHKGVFDLEADEV